ncbi:unannotated protein [freshwater metagenome]|uniref:Unannotated protein n=1 Tax=freshwater metagenome TaxID=449393 RepID=A0A6J7H2Y5_9ZZZZ|nr:hypothetical protein [Actinomycetota bacterium]
MPELRVDPLTGLRVLIAGERADRPGTDLRPPEPDPAIDPERDPFLEGHEDRTPAELDAERPGGSAPDTPGWLVRVVPNLYPALEADSPDPPREARIDLFSATGARGAHEVIVNTPLAIGSLGDLPVAQLEHAMAMWQRRIRHHRRHGTAYAHLFVNDGREAGASQPHTHAQLAALPFVPALIARERERCGAHAVTTGGASLLGDLVQQEVRLDQRLVDVDDDTVLLTPFASGAPYQLLIAPRRPAMRWEDEGQPTAAAMLRAALDRLRRHFDGVLPPFNLWVRTAPQGSDHFCWHIDIRPRFGTPAGLELGTGIELNAVAPERAARELRDA